MKKLDEDTQLVYDWILDHFPSAGFDSVSYHPIKLFTLIANLFEETANVPAHVQEAYEYLSIGEQYTVLEQVMQELRERYDITVKVESGNTL